MTDAQKGGINLLIAFALGIGSTKISWNETVLTVALTVVVTLFLLTVLAHVRGKKEG